MATLKCKQNLVTPGVGDTVAAEDISSVKYQIIKRAAGLTGSTARGTTPYRSAALTAKAAVKASAGQVYSYHVYNPNATDAYLQFYNVASASVTPGTTTPEKTLWVPAGGAVELALEFPWDFATAVTIAPTTTITGGTAPSTGLLVNIDYV